MSKTVPFQTIQLSISKQFSSIQPIDRTQPGATTLGQSGPGTNDNEWVLSIPKSSCITGTSPSDFLVSYPGHWLVGLLGFYGISTFAAYLMPNPFLYK